MDASQTFEEKLINLVQEKEFLFSKSRSYKNVVLRDATWATIAEQLDRPVDECKQRWKSLRDRYVREKKKNEQPSGSSCKFHQEWEFSSSLSFLDVALQPRKQSGNYEEFSALTPDDSCAADCEETSPETETYETPKQIRKTNRKREAQNEDTEEKFGLLLGSLTKTFSTRFNKDEDNTDIYLKLLGKKLKILPEHIQNSLQEKFLKECNEEILKFRNAN